LVIIAGDARSGDLIMPLTTRLTERLGIMHRVLLAPMGAVSGGALAGAVTAAGGPRLIGGGYGAAEWLDRQFAAAANHRVGCGFITVRAMRNDFVARWHGSEADLRAAQETEIARYLAAARDGDFAVAGVLGGEAIGLFDAVLPAGEIVTRTVAEAEAALRDGARRVVARAPG
jgi:NAD(P)H-dependent flavin oxidoreductase YrpB (nitropropane dioxygenase family)